MAAPGDAQGDAGDLLDRILAAGLGAALDMGRYAAVGFGALGAALGGLLLVASPGEMWPAALLVLAFFGGLAVLAPIGLRRHRARGLRVRETIRARPDEVAEIAHRRGGQPGRPGYGRYMLITIVLRDGTSATMRVAPPLLAEVRDQIARRCPAAIVHEGFPSKKLRAGPVARVVRRP
jgi:hypothetical protein